MDPLFNILFFGTYREAAKAALFIQGRAASPFSYDTGGEKYV